MRRFAGDVEQGCGGEIELEPINGKEHAKPQPIAFAEPDVRAGFVRKVYGIIAMQLVLTTVIAGVLVHHGRQWLHSSPSVVLGVVTFSCVMSLVLACVFACCPETMRCSPLNYGLLALLTAAEGVLVGFACLQYTLGSVVLCAGLTAFVVVGLSAYAMWTKHDMTSFGPYLFCGLCVLCGTGLFLSMVAALGLTHNPMFGFAQVLYAAGGALAFSIFIVHDTQLIMGGGHKHEFSVDDYAMAAICLYLDIIQLFLSILRLLGDKDDSGL
mmetsp:Transcript_149841/g.417482  ORF Transcript_149841/g.417482 Transcript_149841/m.417482 type:complete len:269 (+) Transcript_149841:108-914(+)|eukprot:CAMPEP_0179118356 /NCGR_PEP_ID=MMETSP0796-20121207/55654_1 /TAXON_ID=73915 /ORGANISM="Pyrodinium bahamense, Strain pbaha01" /LENGTH=268 /DNA_ID=CAMNT_0020816797 /DNA_START=65 /DNA_END=871 /DNA_ORIENTATION=+